MSEEETRRTVELERYFSVLPAFRGMYQSIDYKYDDIVNTNITNPYASQNEESLSIDNLRLLLEKNEVLENTDGSQVERYWPGDKQN